MAQTADETEKRIVEQLRENPRATNREIAEKLDLAQPTIADRIRQMVDRCDIRVVAQRHMFTGGYTTMYFLLLNTSTGPVQKIGQEVATRNDILSVLQGVGNPDLVLMVRAKSIDDIYQLSKEIGHIRGVASIEGIVCCAIHKYIANAGELKAPEAGFEITEETDLEERILAILSGNARLSNREVGRQVGVTETAIRHRLRKMLKNGQIQFEVVSHPSFIGMNIMAIARVSTDPKRTDTIIEKLMGLDRVGFIAEVTGQHNLLLFLNATSNQELGNFCDNKLQTMPGLERLDVHLIVSIMKHQFNFAYFGASESIPKRK